MVTITCYGKTKEYETREEVIAFFKDCYFCSEGAERERYAKILMELIFSNREDIYDED